MARWHSEGSAIRYERGRALLHERRGEIDVAAMRELLSDHETSPSLCRHATESDRTSKTVFWVVADITDRRVRFGRGNPCDSREQTYAFA
ncbi:MAG: hypothetical protein WD206_03165 [Actinomycetota bacterium]